MVAGLAANVHESASLAALASSSVRERKATALGDQITILDPLSRTPPSSRLAGAPSCIWQSTRPHRDRTVAAEHHHEGGLGFEE